MTPACVRGQIIRRMREAHLECTRPPCPRGQAMVDHCECAEGWFGHECDVPAEECARERCGADGRGTCTGQTAGCRCQPPASGDGCRAVDCGSNGRVAPNGTCLCSPGWTGPACGVRACGRFGVLSPTGACECRGHAVAGADGTCSGLHACGPTGWLGGDALCRCEPGGFRGGPNCGVRDNTAVARNVLDVRPAPGPVPAAAVWAPLAAGAVVYFCLVMVAVTRSLVRSDGPGARHL